LRTDASGSFCADYVLGDHEIAAEVKATTTAADKHLRGLRAFREEYPVRRAILVSLDPRPRTTDDGIDILPWEVFLQQFWNGEIIR